MARIILFSEPLTSPRARNPTRRAHRNHTMHLSRPRQHDRRVRKLILRARGSDLHARIARYIIIPLIQPYNTTQRSKPIRPPLFPRLLIPTPQARNTGSKTSYSKTRSSPRSTAPSCTASATPSSTHRTPFPKSTARRSSSHPTSSVTTTLPPWKSRRPRCPLGLICRRTLKGKRFLVSIGTVLKSLADSCIQFVVVSCGEREERVVSDLPEFHERDRFKAYARF